MSEPKKILIVEDDRNIAELLQLHLREEGFEITRVPMAGRGLNTFNKAALMP